MVLYYDLLIKGQAYQFQMYSYLMPTAGKKSRIEPSSKEG